MFPHPSPLPKAQNSSLEKLLPSKMKWKIMIDVIFSSISDIDGAFFNFGEENVFLLKKFCVISKWEKTTVSLWNGRNKKSGKDVKRWLINYERRFYNHNFSRSGTRMHELDGSLTLGIVKFLTTFLRCDSDGNIRNEFLKTIKILAVSLSRRSFQFFWGEEKFPWRKCKESCLNAL